MSKYILLSLFTISINVFSANYEVKMLNQGAEGVMIFEPAVLKINIGDTVNFVSTDPAHNSASLPGMIPQGAQSWSSELSKDISVTFNQEGIYAYQCTPHAVMAMVDLARSNPNNPTSLAEISLRQGISLSFLEQIFLKLKKNNLVQSSRGSFGGYFLTKSAKNINSFLFFSFL